MGLRPDRSGDGLAMRSFASEHAFGGKRYRVGRAGAAGKQWLIERRLAPPYSGLRPDLGGDGPVTEIGRPACRIDVNPVIHDMEADRVTSGRIGATALNRGVRLSVPFLGS
jgi:hypothetical protein